MRNQPRNCATCHYVGAIHMSASESGHFVECEWLPGLPAPAWLLDAPRLVPIDIASRCECYRPRPKRAGARRAGR